MRPRRRRRKLSIRAILLRGVALFVCSFFVIYTFLTVRKDGRERRSIRNPALDFKQIPPFDFKRTAFPDEYKIDDLLDMCIPVTDYEAFKSQLKRRINSKCNTAPMELADFVCSANCHASEPELERGFRFFSVAKYSFKPLVRLCRRQKLSALIWIKDNKPLVHVCGKRVLGSVNWLITQKFLSLLLCAVKVPDVLFGFDNSDWAVPRGDSGIAGWLQPLPGIVRYVGTDAHPSLLFPTAPYLRTTTHCDLTRSEAINYGALCRYKPQYLPEWNEKKDDIFWRGSSTGVPLDKDILTFLPRPAFMMKFFGKPGYDLGFTGGDPPANDEEYVEFFRRAHRDHVDREDFARYKYLVHMDGHTASWGLAHKLLSTSAVLWVPSGSSYREFYYAHLFPLRHYIPLSMDLHDVEDLREWLLISDNNLYAAAVAKNAEKLFEERLTPEATYCYTVRLLHFLARTQQQAPTQETLLEVGLDAKSFKLFEPYDKLTSNEGK